MVLSLHLLWCIIKGYIFDAGNVFIEKLYTELFSMTCNRMSSIYTLRTSTITVYYTSSNVHHSVVKSYCCTTLYQIRILIKFIQSTFTRQQRHFRHSNAQLCYGSGFSMWCAWITITYMPVQHIPRKSYTGNIPSDIWRTYEICQSYSTGDFWRVWYVMRFCSFHICSCPRFIIILMRFCSIDDFFSYESYGVVPLKLTH